MPLQRFDVRAVDRPAGLIPPTAPLDGVTELRVHGVGGTTPESLLGDSAPLQVSGDRIAGFYRTADVQGRHVEAYSWGGLTSRSGARALWVVLLPFALANLAGWMCAPKVHDRPLLFGLHRASVRWASLGLTVNFALIATMMFVDVVAYQCGAQEACVAGRWWLAPLRDAAVAAYPGRRVVLGAIGPLAVIAVLAVLTRFSLGRYEAVEPPYHVDQAETRVRNQSGAAVRGRDLADPMFWDGEQSTRRMGRLHVAVALTFLALVVAHVAGATSVAAGAIPNLGWVRLAVFAVGGVVTLGSVALLAVDLPAGPNGSRFGGDQLARLALYLAGATMAAAIVFAWVQPAWTPVVAGPLPGVRSASLIAWIAVLAPVVLVAVPTLLAGRVPHSFRWGPTVATALGSLILNLVGLALLIQFAEFVSRLSFGTPTAASAGATVYVSPAIGQTMPDLAGWLLAPTLGFGLYQVIRYRQAGRVEADVAAISDEYRAAGAPVDSEPAWTYSVLTDAPASAAGRTGRLGERGERWLSRIARSRRAAVIARDVDWLLIGIVSVGVGVIVTLLISAWQGVDTPSASGLVLRVGSAIVTAMPLLLLVLVRNSWRSVENRRRLGILWDIGTFWPRAYHPLAPPCYAERAVPELQRRLWRLHDSGGRAVIAAHSQGAVVSAAALLQVGKRPVAASIALATFGAPLRKLYQWAFPYYFRDEVLRDLATPDRTHLVAWRNYFYLTDYIGGAALDGHPDGVDRRLLDPRTSWLIYGQLPPPIGTHSGYWTDPLMWSDIDKLAAQV